MIQVQMIVMDKDLGECSSDKGSISFLHRGLGEMVDVELDPHKTFRTTLW
ncbi:hypothetical protein [Paenibacillus sp. IHBB 10380]|nr:hypothetical protein [Paenibacillus sp. IHBB 10380]